MRTFVYNSDKSLSSCFTYIRHMDALTRLTEHIHNLNSELKSLSPEPEDVPEFSIRSNVLRRNSYLAESNRIRAQIIEAYAEYTTLLEDTVTTVIEVQRGLSSIIKSRKT